MSSNYDDIINLPHHTSKTRPRMSRQDRAAQFSPFAALTGYDDVVKETARLTNKRVELTEDEKSMLDEKLRLVMESGSVAAVTWFQPDLKKSGGAYVTTTSRVKKTDQLHHLLVMEDGTQIPIDAITDIDSNIFLSAD